MASTTSAQIAFAAEFATFVVALVGALTVLRSPDLTRRSTVRPLLVGGFTALAAAAFLRGAITVGETGSVVPTWFRVVGLTAIALGLPRWRSRRGALLLGLGVAVGVAAVLTLLADRTTTSDVLRLVAALLLAAALVDAARRRISLRIAVEGAILVLVVVLVVAVTVSITVSRDVEREAFGRYEARVRAEAETAAANARGGLGPARVVAGVLASERAGPLARMAEAAPTDEDVEVLEDALTQLTDDQLLDLREPVIVLSATGRPVASRPSDLSDATRLAIAGDAVVTDALAASADRQGVIVVGGEAHALSVAPITVRPADAPAVRVGLVVVAHRLDDAYLRLLGTGGESLGFALATPTRVLAASDADARSAASGDAVRGALSSGSTARSRVEDGFVVAAAVPVDTGRSPLALVVVAPGEAAREAQLALFRVLFLVALGATFLAVTAAALMGERIGRGLRTLTGATRSLRDGDLDAQVDLAGDDELAALGRSFTDMAASIRGMTVDLRRAAADEATLRARLEAVISGMSEALVAIDATGAVIELNVAAEELLATTRARARERPVSDLVRWRADDGTAVPMRRSDLPDGVAMAADVAVHDGSVPVEVTAGSLLDEDGDDAGAVLVFRDVRRERQVEDLKASILANIGHELRTPLTPIKGYAAVLRDRDVPTERTRAFATEIVEGVDQLERVVRRLVTFATISAGHLRPEIAAVASGELAEAIQRRWAGKVPPTHELEVIDDGAPGRIVVDRALLDLAVDELVDNALKYSPEGGTVGVRLASTRDLDIELQAPGPVLLVEVTDPGVGFDPDALQVLTDPFIQQDGSATRRFGGLGLGLACADRIVRAHGGRLGFRSNPHDVTAVTILLPAAPSA